MGSAKMKLRSQRGEPVFQQAVRVNTPSKNISEFTPEFFDESSKAWRSNKKEVTKGIYTYKDDVPLRRSQRVVEKEKEKVKAVVETQYVRRSARLATKSVSSF